MALADDIADLRSKGVSDDDILKGVTQVVPDMAPDIADLQKQGKGASDILNGVASLPSSQAAPKHYWRDLMQAGAYGAQKELQSHAETAKDLGAPGAADALNSGADVAHGFVSDDYQPAHVQLLHPSTWLDAPQALMEGVASMGGYGGASAAGGAVASVLGPEATPIGAGIGAGLYGLSKYLGNTADARAVNNGHVDANGNPAPTTGDIVGALPSAGVQAGIDYAGLKGAHILGAGQVAKGAGLEALSQIGKQTARDAAINAAAGGASNAVGQLGDTAFTDKGVQFNPEEVANAAATGGLTGAGMRLVQRIPDMYGAVRNVPGDPESQGKLADMMLGDRVTGDPTDPKQRNQVIDNTKALLIKDTSDALKAVNAANADQVTPSRVIPGGQHDAALAVAQDAITNLKNGSVLDDNQVQNLKDTLGGNSTTQPLLDPILMRSELNRLGNDMHFTSMSDAVEQHSPYWARSALGLVMHALRRPQYAVGAAGIGGFLTHSALGYATGIGIPLGVMALAKLGDRIVGNPDRLSDYVSRFGSAPDITGSQPQQPPMSVAQMQAAAHQPQALPRGPMSTMPEPAPSGPPINTNLPPLAVARARMTLAQMQAAAHGPVAAPSGASSEAVAPNAPVPPSAPMMQPPQAAPAPQARPAPPAPQEVSQAATDALRARMAAVAPQAAQQAAAPTPPPAPRIAPNGPVQGTRTQVQETWAEALARAQAVIQSPSSTPEQIAEAKLVRATAVRNIANPELQKTPLPRAAVEAAQVPPEAANASEPPVTDMPDGYHVQLSNGQAFQANADTRISKEARVAATLKRHAGEMSKLEGLRHLDLSADGKSVVKDGLSGWQHEAAHNTKTMGDARFLGKRIVGNFRDADAAKVQAHLEAPDENGGNFYSNWSDNPNKITKSREEAGRAVGLMRAKAKAAKQKQ